MKTKIKRTNKNLAEWYLLIYMLQMEIDNQNKPRLKKMKKHHIDGELIHAKFIEPYCDELEKYLDVCQVFESGHLPVTATTDVISVFNIIDKVVRDEMMF